MGWRNPALSLPALPGPGSCTHSLPGLAGHLDPRSLVPSPELPVASVWPEARAAFPEPFEVRSRLGSSPGLTTSPEQGTPLVFGITVLQESPEPGFGPCPVSSGIHHTWAAPGSCTGAPLMGTGWTLFHSWGHARHPSPQPATCAASDWPESRFRDLREGPGCPPSPRKAALLEWGACRHSKGTGPRPEDAGVPAWGIGLLGSLAVSGRSPTPCVWPWAGGDREGWPLASDGLSTTGDGPGLCAWRSSLGPSGKVGRAPACLHRFAHSRSVGEPPPHLRG